MKDALRKRHRWDERVHRSGPVPGEIARDTGEGDKSKEGRTSTMERVMDPRGEELEVLWDREWEEGLFRRAFETLKSKLSARQFQVFDLYVRKEWPASEVARAMGMSIAAVYLTKHRVAAALKREVAALQERLEGVAGRNM